MLEADCRETYVLAFAGRRDEVGTTGPDHVSLAGGTITESLVGHEAGGSAGGSLGVDPSGGGKEKDGGGLHFVRAGLVTCVDGIKC